MSGGKINDVIYEWPPHHLLGKTGVNPVPPRLCHVI